LLYRISGDESLAGKASSVDGSPKCNHHHSINSGELPKFGRGLSIEFWVIPPLEDDRAGEPVKREKCLKASITN